MLAKRNVIFYGNNLWTIHGSKVMATKYLSTDTRLVRYVGSKRSLRTIAKDAIITGASGGIFGGSYTAFEFARDVYNDNKKAPRNSTTYVVMFPTTNRTASTSYSRVGSARTVRLFP